MNSIDYTHLEELVEEAFEFLLSYKEGDRDEIKADELYRYLFPITIEAFMTALPEVEFINWILCCNYNKGGMKYEIFLATLEEMGEIVADYIVNGGRSTDGKEVISRYRKLFITNNFKMSFEVGIDSLKEEIEQFFRYLEQLNGESIKDVNLNDLDRSIYAISEEADLHGIREINYVASILRYNLDRLESEYKTFLNAAYQMRRIIVYYENNRSYSTPKETIANFRSIFISKGFLKER